jgi:hypothetical protein
MSNNLPLAMQRALIEQLPSYSQNSQPADVYLQQLNRQDSVMDQAVGSTITSYVSLRQQHQLQQNSQSNGNGNASVIDSTPLPPEVASALAGNFTNVALETKVLADLNAEFNEKVKQRSIREGGRAATGVSMKVARSQRMDVLKREILSKYNVNLAADQMRDRSAPPRWINEFLGNAQWRVVLKDLIAKYPQCQLLTHAAREMAKRGHVSEIDDLQTAARVPSMFMQLVSDLLPKICRGDATSSQPAHVTREANITKLCSVAHQNEAVLIYAVQLVSKLQEQRWALEVEGGPSPLLLRLMHLQERLRNWAWTEAEQVQVHHEETVALSSAMFRWSCKRDRALNNPTDESIAIVTELRHLYANSLRKRLDRKKQSAKMSRINPITSVDFCQRYHSVLKSTPMEKRGIFRDSIVVEALLFDLVFPLAQLKTQHRSEVAGCLASSMVIESGDRTKLEKLLSASSELCNTLPKPDIFYNNQPKFENLLTTRIVARGLVVWIKESLSSSQLYDGQDYQRSVFFLFCLCAGSSFFFVVVVSGNDHFYFIFYYTLPAR